MPDTGQDLPNFGFVRHRVFRGQNAMKSGAACRVKSSGQWFSSSVTRLLSSVQERTAQGRNPNDATEGGETSRRRNNREQGQVFVGEPYADFAVQQSLLEPLIALEHALDRNLEIRFLVHGGVALPKRAPAPQESDRSDAALPTTASSKTPISCS